MRRLGVVSLEDWDEVWRRNQHLSAGLFAAGRVDEIVFVEPPRFGRTRTARPHPGVLAVRPGLLLPRRAGGYLLAGWWLRRTRLRRVDVLWVNDAAFGVRCATRSTPVVHDVTDDWRESAQAPRVRRRLVRAEDRLAVRARTTVCSAELARRWAQRYGVAATVIGNGVDTPAVRSATPYAFAGSAPHVGYVGTLHGDRLDLDLVVALARRVRPGTVHLVGPDHLSDAERARLDAEPNVEATGAVPTADVPGRLAGCDVLVCPHLVTPFTRSLDAIKAYEYLATTRPVVATASSGFPELAATPGLQVVEAAAFCDAVVAALATSGEPVTRSAPPDWSARAEQFAAVLADAAAGSPGVATGARAP